MYKTLVVSDQESILEVYRQVDNWGFNGFHVPHIRHDPEGAKEGLSSHHVDAISIALESPEAEEELLVFLRDKYPLLPIFESGRTVAETQAYLGELRQALNWLRADFSSDSYDENVMMIRARRHFFRRLVSGRQLTTSEMYRKMRMLRSRMDPRKPCIVMKLERSAEGDDRLIGTLQDSEHLLERELFHSFGGDVKGVHVLPLVTGDGNVYVMAGVLRGQEPEEDITVILDRCVQDGLLHVEKYRGLRLALGETRVLPSFYAFCTDYAGEGRDVRK